MEEFFENVRLYSTPKTNRDGRLVLRYICEDCGQETESSKYFETPCSPAGVPLVHQTKFWCEECWLRRRKG